MLVYRISHNKYTEHLNGEGAYRVGGRWNTKGVRMVYTSTSISLSSLEVLVHTDGLPIVFGLILLTFEVPDECVYIAKELPSDWKKIPPTKATKSIGDEFISSGKQLGLMVPSVVIPEEFNVLLNPLHIDMSKVKVVGQRDYIFDGRL